MGRTGHFGSLTSQKNVKIVEVDSPIEIIQNLVGYPAQVERYLQKES